MAIDSDNSNPKVIPGKKAGQMRSTQAPGQFYGYSIQTTRMVARLLRCTHSQAVSVEVLDDVAVTGGSEVVAEQSKSGLAHNPVADRSVDLWKTLFNWVNAIRSGALATETKFVLYTAQPYSGSIVAKLHEVKRPEDAASIIDELRYEFWGSEPKYAKKPALPDTIKRYVNSVLGASNDVLSRLFAGFEYVAGSGSPVDDLTPLLKEKAIGDGAIDDILNSVLGWTKRRVEHLIEARKPPIIKWDDFNRQLVAAARKFDRSELLAPTPLEITESEIQQELKSRQYIQQLRWIELPNDELVQAVNDYLRSSVDRTAWSERGDVLESSFAEFSDRLERYWENQKRLASIELQSRSASQMGQAVLARCSMASEQLQGLEVPSYFVPGSYHALADTFTVGWHPRFDALRRQPAKTTIAAAEENAEDERGAKS